MASHAEKDILFETPRHFVLAASHGFDVYRIGLTHSTRCAQIGYRDEEGLARAIAEIARRESPTYRVHQS